jgi:hypothetical protein
MNRCMRHLRALGHTRGDSYDVPLSRQEVTTMRGIWIFGAALLGGCVARVSNSPPPVATTVQPVAVVPVEQPQQHPLGGPPGQDPNFVPPGQGGVPPGQAKKVAAIDEVAPGHASHTVAASHGNAGDSGNDHAKPKEKKKIKAKAKKDK